jgi:hypothetical protein
MGGRPKNHGSQEAMCLRNTRDGKPNTQNASRARRHHGRSSQAEELHGSRRACHNTKRCAATKFYTPSVLPLK